VPFKLAGATGSGGGSAVPFKFKLGSSKDSSRQLERRELRLSLSLRVGSLYFVK
jgi:hypothetical protein